MNDINIKQYEAQIFKIKGIKNFVVIKSKENKYYLTSAYVPWYGFYNFLLPTNRRRGKKLTDEELNRIDLIEIYHANNLSLDIRNIIFIVIILPILFLINNSLLSASKELSYTVLLLFALMGASFLVCKSVNNETKELQINKTDLNYLLKIKSNNALKRNLNFIITISIVILLERHNCYGAPFLAVFSFLDFKDFYGSIGDMKTFNKIGPGPNMSFYKITKWGQEENIEFEPPLLLSAKKNSK